MAAFCTCCGEEIVLSSGACSHCDGKDRGWKKVATTLGAKSASHEEDQWLAYFPKSDSDAA